MYSISSIQKHKIMAEHKKNASPSKHDKHTNRDTKIGKQQKHESNGGSYKTGGSPKGRHNKW